MPVGILSAECRMLLDAGEAEGGLNSPVETIDLFMLRPDELPQHPLRREKDI